MAVYSESSQSCWISPSAYLSITARALNCVFSTATYSKTLPPCSAGWFSPYSQPGSCWSPHTLTPYSAAAWAPSSARASRRRLARGPRWRQAGRWARGACAGRRAALRRCPAGRLWQILCIWTSTPPTALQKPPETADSAWPTQSASDSPSHSPPLPAARAISIYKALRYSQRLTSAAAAGLGSAAHWSCWPVNWPYHSL